MLVFVAPPAAALAEAGYHAVAPDKRGYGQTDRPEAIDQYTLLHLVGDMVGLLDALGAADGGDRRPRLGRAGGLARRAAAPRPLPRRRRPQRPLPAARPVRPTTRHAAEPTPPCSTSSTSRSPASPRRSSSATRASDPAHLPLFGLGRRAAPAGAGRRRTGRHGLAAGRFPFRDASNPTSLPGWLSEADIDFYAGEFARTGFRGGLNWYRNIDRNWELFAPFAGARVTVPALYIAGDRDLVVHFRGMDQLLRQPDEFHPATAPDDHAAGMRSLDPAGARRRGQCGNDRLPATALAPSRW